MNALPALRRARYHRTAMDDPRARRVDFVREHRWGLAFGIAIAITFLTLPMRPRDAGFAYDLLPLAALGLVWIIAGVALGALATFWARPRADELPVARSRR